MKKLIAILMVTLLVIGISTVGVAAARSFAVALAEGDPIKETTGEDSGAGPIELTITVAKDKDVKTKKDIVYHKYKTTFTVAANQAVTFSLSDNAKGKKDKEIVKLEKIDEESTKVVIVGKNFFKKTIKDVVLTAAAGEEKAEYKFTVKPTFTQYLLIVLLFGWIWY